MAYQQVALELVRDGQGTPWGFRMTGGADIGSPLNIQKVTLGSPSEGELYRGDLLLQIRGADAVHLSHKGATDLVSKAGSTLKLVVARCVSLQPSSGTCTPTTASINGNPFLFKPLPTSHFLSQQRQRRCSAESYTSTSSDPEKEAITNQPYRSTPLILPGAKSSKDIPSGSYLRFDPLTRSSTPPNVGLRLGDACMITRIQEAVLEAAHSSSPLSSPRRTPTPDLSNQFYLRQYNTPINMYSNQAIVEALAAQTMRNPAVSNAEILENKKMTNITQSPTYQLIHGEELKKGKIEEYEPLQEHVYNVPARGGDHYRPEIHQSGSFKSIMHDLRGVSDF